ncbi:N-6 DNA methylase [Helicobacter sp. 16-1353]|uniref:N-6 DNA methylase n=1 Tax=Helicobacter sp. 16-1353 TaxID=2004996 RepID=UPI000DCCA651|nr:N-6 DNA methylase [Helicobacter sp. 16-1353]RAX54903.1 N-6 DNA methylase [Helicobacter sp. 16-1353]
MEIKIDNNKIFSPLRNKWLILTPEEEVRQNYICRLINAYGYSLEQMDEELKVNNSHRGQGKARADIVIWKSKEDKKNKKSAFIVVECKAETVKIKQEDYYQGANYAAWSGANFFVTTNARETKFFKVDKDSLPKELDEIIDIPKAAIINDQKKIDKLLSQTKAFSRDEFAKLLQKCHNIIRNNDKLSPEAAFDEISKILFMKIRYERNPDEDVLFSLDKFQRDEKHFEKNIKKHLPIEAQMPYMQYLFKATKDEFAEDKLFDSFETIKIKQYSFEQIVKELEKYNLSATSDDIKGIAFEHFLGTTFRGELGQFFTPRTIVDFMVEVLDPKEGETVCDPTCGSGGFLIKSFEYIRDKIEKDVEENKKVLKAILFNGEYEKMTEEQQSKVNEKYNEILKKINYDINIPNKSYSKQSKSERNRRISKLSSSCIYGTDANPRMARTSKMNMIMHGDGHGGVHHHDGLININGIFEGRFDVILTNPPFGARVEKDYKLSETDRFYDDVILNEYKEHYGEDCIKQINELNNAIDKGQKVLDRFDLGKVSGLTEVLFMERCLNLLKKGGRMGIVLPEGILNNANLQKVRDYIESKAKILLITSIPSDVFIASGATIKPSLLFFKKFTEQEENQYAQIKAKVEKEIKESVQKEIDKYFKTEKDKIILLNLTSKKSIATLNLLEKKCKKLFDKEFSQQMETIGKEKIKKLFNYEIPMVQVEKAGITTTGGQCENELIKVAEEFKKYREEKQLWQDNSLRVTYKLQNDDLLRIINGEEQVINE